MNIFGGPNPQLGNRMSQHSFAKRPDVKMARSIFDRSHAAKDTFTFDELVPVLVDEIIPGDTINLSMNTFIRLATQYVPVMDNMYVDFFFFFVPNRLVFDNWEKMCGAQDNPGDSTDYVFPTITSPADVGWAANSIYDHMGLPINVPGLEINALPLRCYNLIWNEWIRDQNMQDSLTVPKDDGPDASSDYVLQKRGKRHDYFTSCLPFLQKGPAVDLPLGTLAPISGIGKLDQTFDEAGQSVYETARTGTVTYANSAVIESDTHSQFFVTEDPNNTGYPGIYANLAEASSATINQLRQAFQMQALFELDARGGTRYVEILQAHYNVTSPDFRLQRPEFLGGGSQKISSHPVPNTTGIQGDVSNPTTGNIQGALSAFGTSAGQGIGFTKSFVEHGYVIGMMCARADLTYQQGINRMWSKSTRYDLFWPKLQELGEQAVLNKEIYAQGTGHETDDEGVFGYQERYAEYRFKPSEIRGQFRSTYATPIDYYHLAEDFSTLPALNSTFIEQSTPIERVIYDTISPALLADMWFIYKHARPMMTYSTPVSLGRF